MMNDVLKEALRLQNASTLAGTGGYMSLLLQWLSS